MLIDTLEVQRPLNKWYFRKDRYFSRDLPSSIWQGVIFLMVVDFQGTQKNKNIKNISAARPFSKKYVRSLSQI